MIRRPRAVVVAFLSSVLLAGLTVLVASAAHAEALSGVSVASTTSLPTSLTSVTVTVGSRAFEARLVQPTGAAPGAYPVVAFAHGFLQRGPAW